MARHLLVLLAALVLTDLASTLGGPGEHRPKEWPCPSDNDILPCTCEPDEYLNLNMDCSAVLNEGQLRKIFEAIFPFPNIYNFTIAQNITDLHNIRKLDSGIFADIMFEYVTITGTKIQTVSENVFTNSHETLVNLDLSDNLISGFPFETLNSFSKLETFLIDDNLISELPLLDSSSLQVFSISGNSLLRIEDDVFLGAQKLKSVSIGNIGLENLAPGLFSDLPDLEVVMLNDNLLEELAEGALNTMNTKLSHVSMAGNKISSVIHDSIVGMIEGAHLSMANNEITQLEESVWRSIFNQVHPGGIVDLEENPLACGCDLKWIFDEKDRYLPLISRLSTCASGILVQDLNPDYFDKYCP